MEDQVKNDGASISPIAYEETPLIDPANAPEVDVSSVIPEATHVFADAPVVEEAPMHSPVERPFMPEKPKRKRHIGTIIFIVILFGLGIWLSSQLRSFFAPTVREEIAIPTLSPSNGLPSGSPLPTSPLGSGAKSSWQTMDVVSGATKKPMEGISYQLPNGIKAPVCDSASCASQGTNLPGGTRFTIAARGKGQLLPDFRGAILTDVAGREFVMKQVTIGTRSVYEYVGDFTGRTIGGYTFTKMRGVLVPISDTLAVDFNHFATSGVTTDFAADDAVFDDIIKSFKGSAPMTIGAPTVKPTVNFPSSTPTTTSAGF